MACGIKFAQKYNYPYQQYLSLNQLRMNIIKTILIAGLLTGSAVNMSAQGTGTGTALVVEAAEGEPTVIPMTVETRIAFSTDGTRMLVTPATGMETQSFNVADVNRVTFDLTYSGTDDIMASAGEVSIVNRDGKVIVSAPGVFHYGVWNMSGVCITSGDASDNVTLDFSSRPDGVYVIMAAGKTIKFINR